MKVGLEVHQQLASRKLFCECPSELREEVTGTFARRLRAAGGERQLVDAAAAFQASRQLRYRYEVTAADCLVELDEEPPHALNEEALAVALAMAHLLRARPLDELEVMRKIVVDGSNTTGFQRTVLVAVDGELAVRHRRYSIPTICLEEDAARRVSAGDGEVRYRLDRLGIPLIEIATGPEIRSGAEAREVAEELGALLRATGRVRRGIGSIREDLNVSVERGTRVEIKGVQELRLVERYVAAEAARQEYFADLADRLRASGAEAPTDPVLDLTDLFEGVDAGPVGAVRRRGGRVLGLGLPGFTGHLRSPPERNERLGRELADYARSAGVAGILHSDELPAHGIDETRVARLRERLRLVAPDAFVLIADTDPIRARAAAESVRARARAALAGVPPETRDPLPDGTTRYSRPLPGRDRMYPETDVPPIVIREELWRRAEAEAPETPATKRARFMRDYHLSADLARHLVGSEAVDRFEALVRRGHPPSLVARLLLQELLGDAEVPETGGAPAVVDDERLHELLAAVERGAFAKEGLPSVLAELRGGAPSVADAVERAGLGELTREELERLITSVVDRNASLVRARGLAAFAPLMGDVMREVRGRRDGEEVARLLREALARHCPPGVGATDRTT